MANSTSVKEAAALMLARLLSKRGLGAEALPPSAVAAGNIETLASATAKLVCLSYLGFGGGPVQIRYAVRRLRRILPEGTLIVVAYWVGDGEEDTAAKMLDVVQADAYASSLHEAVSICEKAATGDLKPAMRDGNGTDSAAPVVPVPPRPKAASKRKAGPAPV